MPPPPYTSLGGDPPDSLLQISSRAALNPRAENGGGCVKLRGKRDKIGHLFFLVAPRWRRILIFFFLIRLNNTRCEQGGEGFKNRFGKAKAYEKRPVANISNRVFYMNFIKDIVGNYWPFLYKRCVVVAHRKLITTCF